MDKRQLASYAYHNCEFTLAIELVRGAAPCEELAAVHVKALCELDSKQDAVKVAELYVDSYPNSGALHYALGTSRYLAGCTKGEIEAAFLGAAGLGYAGGSMGLAMLEAANKRLVNAIQLLESSTTEDRELEHARRLSLFQALTIDGRLEAAEAQLCAADRILSQAPSLLRAYWGELCWVRLLRAKGRFDGALALVERLLAQLDEACAPRLYRNATEAKRTIEAKSDEPNIILPVDRPLDRATQTVAAQALAQIGRKPMLHSLFVYLTERGRAGATKEDIVHCVWDESYNPVIHDDRIYKAIGRLRRILGDDQQAPRYLTQMGRTYVLTMPAGAPD